MTGALLLVMGVQAGIFSGPFIFWFLLTAGALDAWCTRPPRSRKEMRRVLKEARP